MIFSPTTARWQTVIADLSLILFLVAAAALDDNPVTEAAPPPPPPSIAPPTATGETADISLTMWSPGAGAPTLGEWLAEQAPDESQRLAIAISYAPGDFDEALKTAAQLRAASGAAGTRARITIAEGTSTDALVSLVQDDPPKRQGR